MSDWLYGFSDRKAVCELFGCHDNDEIECEAHEQIVSDSADRAWVPRKVGSVKLNDYHRYRLRTNQGVSDYDKMRKALERLASAQEFEPVRPMTPVWEDLQSEMSARQKFAQSVLDSLTREDERSQEAQTMLEAIRQIKEKLSPHDSFSPPQRMDAVIKHCRVICTQVLDRYML